MARQAQPRFELNSHPGQDPRPIRVNLPRTQLEALTRYFRGGGDFGPRFEHQSSFPANQLGSNNGPTGRQGSGTASSSLLKLVFAHLATPPCPSPGITSVPGFAFKKTTRSLGAMDGQLRAGDHIRSEIAENADLTVLEIMGTKRLPPRYVIDPRNQEPGPRGPEGFKAGACRQRLL